MSSDPGRRPEAEGGAGIDELASLLERAGGGERPTSVELAELLWLAAQMAPAEPAPADPRPAVPAPPPPPAVQDPAPPDPPLPPAAPPASPPQHFDERVPLRLPGAADADAPLTPYTTLLAPAPPMLSHPLGLQRTLRPLKRRVPAPVGQELDEEATAHRIAGLGAAPQWWLPVLRPATERWLTLHLVHDTGPTMPVWRPLVRELHTTLAQSGVFRTVELHRLDADGRVRRPGSQESYAPGRTLTLLISDCMGPQWRGGAAGARWYRTLRRWATRMPVAVVQPLPERLWRTSALPAEPAQLAAPWPAAPNATYTVDSYLTEGLPSDVLPLPVLEPAAPWLANWSSLVAGAGRLPGSVGLLGPTPPPAPLDEQGRGDVERLSPEELVLRFRSLASPEAFRLAGHLAVGRPELPVMRLVQAAIERRPQPQHLAEVILSGLLTNTGTGTAPDSYAFRPGVRPLLLRTLPRSAHGRTSELVARVGALIDARAGVAAGEFPVLAPGGDTPAAEGEPFATVRQESVLRLGGHGNSEGLILGRYRLVRRLGQGAPTVWRALDMRLGRSVAVYEYSHSAERNQERLLERLRLLSGLSHPNVVAIHDFGVDGGVPYLVTEFVEGLTVAELTAEGGFQLPFTLLAPLAQQVASGLRTAHEHGVAHGRLTPNSLLVQPDGTVKITHFTAGAVEEPAEDMDLGAFGHLLMNLAGGRSPGDLPGVPDDFRRPFVDAVRDLQSTATFTQRHGRNLLLSPAFDEVLDAITADRIRYRLLGPVRISRGDLPVDIASPRAQALLCMLLLRQGRTVTYEELTAGMWGPHRQHLLEGPGQLLSTYASALRRALGPGVLAMTADGYALHAPPQTIDVHRCEERITQVKSRRDNGDPAGARDAAQYALDLWYGEPLDGVPGTAAETVRTRLRFLRLTLCVTRAELDLELGNFEQAATDLTALLQEHPKREDFRRLHILALNGQGRIAEAIESYETYEGHQEQQHSEPNPAMSELHRELLAAPEHGRATVVAEFTEPGNHRAAHTVLGRTLTWLLSLSDLASNAYEMLARDNGYVVITEPDASVLPILNVVLRELPGALMELEDPPKIRVTFWHTAHFAGPGAPTRQPDLEAALADSTADIVVVLSPALHEELLTSGADPISAFQPVHRSSPTGPTLAWHCSLNVPATASEPEQRDLVRGPFTTRDLRAIPTPRPGRSAVVHTQPDGPLTLLTPDRPLGTRPLRTSITYYEVDLTTHQSSHRVSLPSSLSGSFAASVELSWYVDDPVAFVRGETSDVSGRLLDHLVRTAGRLTRRHPLRRAGAAQLAVRDGLHKWPVPGLSVACSVVLTPEEGPAHAVPEPPPSRTAKRTPSGADRTAPDPTAVLDAAEMVLLGFDGPLTRLHRGQDPGRVTRDLLALFVERRHPDDALAGERLLSPSNPKYPVTDTSDPLDLLRAVAHHRLGTDLRQELDRIELAAVATARPTAHSDALIDALGALGPQAAVVSDVSAGAITAYLTAHGLTASVAGGVHGRSDDLTLLMPDPDCLLRALGWLETSSPEDALLITSSLAEVAAAKMIGLPVLGYAPTERIKGRLTHAGCRQIVTSLLPVLEAVRAD
ncbi:SAV_2336 N-terminal domain-related protein [Streptomyces sp. R21]|uniref:SAV_2336 N-terminal domain-related protein n=1 Tax=Streptomyces sp. R21 TaxID=3238627 RepID=A0AB39PCI1_9ACTN